MLKNLDEKTLLDLLPVLSSCAMATFTVTGCLSILPFLTLDIPDRVLQIWFEDYVWKGFMVVICLAATSLLVGSTGYANATGNAKAFYGWGLGFTVVHFLFGFLTAPAIKRIVNGSDPKAELRIWLRIHTVRLLTADLPALAAFSRALLNK